MKDAWNPDQYRRFANERQQPFYDLLALLEPSDAPRVVDLGSGTGELTLALHRHVGAASTLGVDRSEAMSARAEARPEEGLSFQCGDLTEILDAARYDVLFSNAALHWLADHPTLFARLAGALAERGQLAVQMPDNAQHVAYRVADEVAARPPFADEMGGYVRDWPVLRPEAYAELLDELGFAEQKVFLRVYAHRLPSRDGVVEWIRGTYLTPYRERLSDASFERFLARLRAELLPRLSERRPFFFPFRRILIWARR